MGNVNKRITIELRLVKNQHNCSRYTLELVKISQSRLRELFQHSGLNLTQTGPEMLLLTIS